jgi:hypothetical protein
MFYNLAANPFLSLVALTVAVIMGGGCTPTASDSTMQDEPISATDDASSTDASASGSIPSPGPSDVSGLSLGPIDDQSLKKMLYDALKVQIVTEGASGGIQTAPGDMGTFEFSIVKLTQGDNDVSNDPRSGADGIEVEISGWLQKTIPAEPSADGESDGKERQECSSFDTTVAVRKTKSGWDMPAGHVFKFSREDAEDCY